jgi:hypothetical protein
MSGVGTDRYTAGMLEPRLRVSSLEAYGVQCEDVCAVGKVSVAQYVEDYVPDCSLENFQQTERSVDTNIRDL